MRDELGLITEGKKAVAKAEKKIAEDQSEADRAIQKAARQGRAKARRGHWFLREKGKAYA